MKKSLVVIMTTGLVLTAANTALARTEANAVEPNPEKGNIVANIYDTTATANDFKEYVQGAETTRTYEGYSTSTHVYGTWNSPFTLGVDGYNYNDPQDYVADGDQETTGNKIYKSGPHGGYLTSTHRCRECHAVHRAAGKFKLLRSDSRFEACDWCHGTGAGSGFNIQMDNNDAFTEEYNVGHTMGYGIDSGKWRAPDDTYPAYAPNYYMGGFSCFDCHSPHANPARLLGYNDQGVATGITGTNGKVYGINNPGHDIMMAGVYGSPVSNNWLQSSNNPQGVNKPFYLAGSWLLIKNPDREVSTAADTVTVDSGIMLSILDSDTPESTFTISPGREIPDAVTTGLLEFDTTTPYPVNKIPTDWNTPIGNTNTLWVVGYTGTGEPIVTRKYADSTGAANSRYGSNVRRFVTGVTTTVTDTGNPQYYAPENEPYGVACTVWSMNEFCTDCHDGNAGLHTTQAPLFSEDRALRNSNAQALSHDHWKGNYDLAYGHDSNPRH